MARHAIFAVDVLVTRDTPNDRSHDIAGDLCAAQPPCFFILATLAI
jgi:hypothetical protein